tara:strand:+ start:1669 stop:2607 length:939 start_codon:yes stop_codon:yes gene_type:complete
VRWLFVLDPLEQLKWESDTSLAIVEAVVELGDEAWYTTLDEMHLDIDSGPWATGYRFGQCNPLQNAISVDPPAKVKLQDFGRIFMRKDPPFNMEYIYATYVLEAAERLGVGVINGPQGLRDCNEKVYALQFPELCPATSISRNPAVIMDFIRAQPEHAICKPLDLMGGRGVQLVRRDDPNLAQIVEQATKSGTERVMVQAFIEEAMNGDKRILLTDREVIGAFVRVPPEGDFRGNLSQGATAHQVSLNSRDKEIVAALIDDLESRGQRFIGIDIIGPYLTEINVTSPMGIRELDELYGMRHGPKIVELLRKS